MARKHLLLAVALLFLPMVCALSEDFRTSAPEQVGVFFCAPATSQLLVSNTGSVASVYSVFLEGPAAGFASVDFPSFVLNPGQTATLTIHYDVPCDFRKSQELRTIVRTSFGLEKSFSQRIVPYTPDNVAAQMSPAAAEVRPCEVGLFTIEVTNPVNFFEEYQFSLKGLDFGTLSEDRVSLAPGASHNVTLRAEPLDCTRSGNFPFEVRIATLQSGVEESLAGTLTIVPDFIPSVELERARYTNYYGEQFVPVRVTNTGDVTAVYDVSVRGPSFASVDAQVLTVAPKDVGVVLVRLNPGEEDVSGTYEVALQLTVRETGNAYAAAPFEVVLRQHNVLTRFYVDHPVISWLIVAAVVLVLLLVAFITWRVTRPEYREKRAKQREVKAREKEKKREIKAKRKEDERKRKEEERARVEAEREKEKREREAQEKSREAERKREAAERERARREDKKFIIREAKKEYFLIDKSEQGFTPVPLWKKVLAVIGVVIVLAVLAFLAWLFWPLVAQFWLTVVVALVIVFLMIIVLIVHRFRSIPYFTRRENRIRSEAKAERERLREERRALKEKARVEREAMREQRRKEREERAEQRRKEREEKQREEAADASASGSSQKRVVSQRPGVWKWLLVLLAIFVVVGLVVLGVLFWPLVVQFWPAMLVGGIVLLVILLVVRAYSKRHIRKQWSSAKGWVFVQTRWRRGLGDVRFKLVGRETDVSVHIDRGRAREVFVVPSARVYQYFGIDVQAEVSRARVSFRVSKNWANRNEVSLQQFGNGAWSPVDAKRVSDDGKYVYYIADVSGSGQFAISGKPIEAPRRWWPWFLIIGVLCVALGVTVALVSETSTPDFNGIPPQVWLQDTVHVIDLTQFFSDPDGDQLRFSVTPVDHMDIFIDGDGRAVFTPDSGFVGEETVIFSATDERGGVVRSNRVLLRVQPAPVPVSYLPYIKWGIIVVLILVLLVVLVRFRRQLVDYIGQE